MAVTGEWVYRCHICGKAIQHIGPHSILYETPLYCRFCKVSHYPTIFEGRELDTDVPFPITHVQTEE